MQGNLDSLLEQIKTERDDFMSNIAFDAQVEGAMKTHRRRVFIKRSALTASGFAVIAALVWLTPIDEPKNQGFALHNAKGEQVSPPLWAAGQDSTSQTMVFSDNSRLSLTPSAQIRVVTVDPVATVIEIFRGGVGFEVAANEQAPNKLWKVVAGPYYLEVNNGKFDAKWSGDHESLDVLVHQGVVRVGGKHMNQEKQILTAGQHFVADRHGAATMRNTRPLAENTPPSANDIARAKSIVTTSVESTTEPIQQLNSPVLSETKTIAANKTVAVQPQQNKDATLEDAIEFAHHAQLRELVKAADEARTQGRTDLASMLFNAIVTRFTDSYDAHRARFILGRMALSAGDHARATLWLNRYLQLADGNHLLREEGHRRLMQSVTALGDQKAAAKAATRYLAEFPRGQYVETAAAHLRAVGH